MKKLILLLLSLLVFGGCADTKTISVRENIS